MTNEENQKLDFSTNGERERYNDFKEKMLSAKKQSGANVEFVILRKGNLSISGMTCRIVGDACDLDFTIAQLEQTPFEIIVTLLKFADGKNV